MAAKPLVLLAEDTLAIRELVDEALTDAGYDVVCASGWAQAYELLRRLLPDVVILDLNLLDPETGLDVLRHMRANPQTARIPAIVYSANTVRLRQLADEIASYDAATLDKPFQIEALVEAVRRCAGGSLAVGE
jgi:CheY-like chemotaxis protein